MTWTHEEAIRHLLRLPWTIVHEVTPEGDQLLRVLEIPSAVGCGSTPKEAELDLWDSLRESLRTYLHFGDSVPVPAGSSEQLIAVQPSLTPYVIRVPETALTAAAGSLELATG